MSWQASSWALRDAPVGGDTTKRMLLMALGEYADPAGRGARPSARTLAVLMHKDVRTVRRQLAALERAGVIRRGDQRLVSHIRPDRRPVVWDLAMPMAGESGMSREQESTVWDEVEHGVTPRPPRAEEASSPSTGVTPLTGREPERGDTGDIASNRRGDIHVPNGVTPVSPNPSKEKTYKPPIAPHGGRTPTRIPRHALPGDWSPNAEARTYALEHSFDLDAVARRFRLWATGEDRRQRNWDARFMLWLANEKPRPDEQPSRPHTHSYACEHVLALLRRDYPNPDELSVGLARLLNQGTQPQEALMELGLPVEDLA